MRKVIEVEGWGSFPGAEVAPSMPGDSRGHMRRPSHPFTILGARFPQRLGSQPWLPETGIHYLSVRIVPIGTGSMEWGRDSLSVPHPLYMP